MNGGLASSRDFLFAECDGHPVGNGAFGRFGIDCRDEPIRAGAEYLFKHQGEDQAFHRPLQESPLAQVRVQARSLRLLIQVGYASDPRTKRGIAWLAAYSFCMNAAYRAGNDSSNSRGA